MMNTALPPTFLLSPEIIARTDKVVLDLIEWLQGRVVSLEASNKLRQARIEELEAKIGKNSSNSDKPPSSDSPFKSKEELPKEATASKPPRKYHKGVRQTLLEPTSVHDLIPERCACGCEQLSEPQCYYLHQHLELPEIAAIVEHWKLFRSRCASCGRTVKAILPVEKRTGFGPRLCATIVELVGVHGDSRRLVQDFVSSVFNLSISQGAIQKIVDRARAALEPHYAVLENGARHAQVNYIDETSWKQKKKLCWLWVMVNGVFAFFKFHPKRSMEAFEARVGTWEGLLVSDGYALYRKWTHGRQTCLAHLIRRAKAVSENPHKDIAGCGAWALSELRRLNHMAEKPPTQGEWLAWYARFIRLIKKNRAKKNVAGQLVRHLEREIDSLWTFLEENTVDSTNNLAERTLRFAVTWRKRSAGSRNEKGQRFAERILSVRQTCRLNGLRTWPILVDAFNALAMHSKPELIHTLGATP